jgi:hypothetical protein
MGCRGSRACTRRKREPAATEPADRRTRGKRTRGKPAPGGKPAPAVRVRQRPPDTFRGLSTCRGPRPPNEAWTTLREAKTTGFGLVNTQRWSRDRQRRVLLSVGSNGATRGSLDLRCVLRRSKPVVWSQRESSAPYLVGADPRRRCDDRKRLRCWPVHVPRPHVSPGPTFARPHVSPRSYVRARTFHRVLRSPSRALSARPPPPPSPAPSCRSRSGRGRTARSARAPCPWRSAAPSSHRRSARP